MFLWLLSILVVLAQTFEAFATPDAIKPEDVLSPEEINQIIEQENFFLRNNFQEGRENWNISRMKYSQYVLGHRDQGYTMKQIVSETLNNGFPMRYNLEGLYRAGMENQVAWGNVIPRVNLSLGEGISPINMNSLFQNLFGFLMPQHWLELVKTKKYHKITKSMLLKTALDETQNAELQYLSLHKGLRDLEILNFYYIHLQILTRIQSRTGVDGLTLDGLFGQVGTDAGKKIGEITHKFNDIALIMNLDRSRNGNYSGSRINLIGLDDFPVNMEDIETVYPEAENKEGFISLVIERSIELEIIKDFFEISRLNLGIVGAGSILGYNSNSLSPQLGLRFSYDTVPRILVARSKNRTAQIDIENELMKIIDLSRRAHDMYTNSIYAYISASSSYKLNQKAFLANLEAMVANSFSENSTAIFMNSFLQMLQAELVRNAIFHLSLKAKTQIKRLLFTSGEEFRVENFEAKKLFEIDGCDKECNPEDKHLKNIFSSVRKKRDLQILLSGKILDLEGKLTEVDSKKMALLVQRYIDLLAHSNLKHRKSSGFYRCLFEYLKQHTIYIPEALTKKIRKRAKVKTEDKNFADEINWKKVEKPGAKNQWIQNLLKARRYKFNGRDYFSQISKKTNKDSLLEGEGA